MSLRRKSIAIPGTPRVISPSPTPSEHGVEYAAPTTRSAARRQMALAQHSLEEKEVEDEDDDTENALEGDHVGDGSPGAVRRSRTRSRSPLGSAGLARMTSSSNTNLNTNPSTCKQAASTSTDHKITSTATDKAVPVNGHLAPPQPSGWSWRDFSRSPSPLGLIPIHRHWRTFVHKHEVPRKVLHVSIGFFVVWLYLTGTRTSSVPPYLMAALIPIAMTDLLRHRYGSVNRFYVRVLGALMRESEYSGFNGVIFYLLGAWAVLYFLPKDVSAMSVLLLSWCDTAASTFGRLWGRYTPRLRRGKSLAGSLAACLVGVAASFFWYGWLVPTFGPMPGDEDFMFKGTLTLSVPSTVVHALGLGLSQTAVTVSGTLALTILSVWNGFMASASEVVDIFGWDDNLTIPVLSGIGIWGFLKLFG
ncbi:hypothetical protein E4U42_004356 [Claviceps africana]|uniref:Phosphatidate cytidylyltransferase n=1 Tax=Claviceps africana TaxID=83212 RepID=A0A8K0JCI4_9HYPO|nr:hypothetical protein E4U42_004356 [Claviceps africana]